MIDITDTWLYHLLAVGSWTKHITCLSLNFLNCKIEIIINTSEDVMQIEWNNAC